MDRERLAWWLVAAGLGAVVGWILVSFLGTVLLGLFVYYATRPVYDRIRARVGNRTVAAVASLLGLALPGLLLIAYTVAVAVRELRSLVGANVGMLDGLLGEYVDGAVVVDPAELVAMAQSDPSRLLDLGGVNTLQGVLGSALSVLSAVTSGLVALTVVLIVAFYLLRDDDRLARWFRERVVGEGSATVAFGRRVDRDLETIYFGNILTAFVIAVVASVTFHALDAIAPSGLGVPAPTLVGLLAGLGSLVPVVGMKLVYVPVAAILAVDAATRDPALLWYPAVFAGVTFVVVDSIPEFVLRPYVSGRDLHLGLVMLAYVVGPALFGWYGLFLGPLLLVVVVHFAGVVLPSLLHGDVEDDLVASTRPAEQEPAEQEPATREAAEPVPSEEDGEGADADADDSQAGGGEPTGE
jgi:predicted PurR-regulated permease PerM